MSAGVLDRDGDAAELYPGLWQWDQRCFGAITIGESRLSLAQFYVWDPDEFEVSYDVPAKALRDAVEFVSTVIDQRGEFARLLLVIADVDRRCRRRREWAEWWEVRKYRREVAAQLHRCLDALEVEGGL